MPSQYNLLVMLGPLLGLAFSFLSRRKPWGVFIWVPTLGTLLYGFYLITRRMLALSVLRGPEAMARLEYIFLLPALVICIGGLIGCYYSRPRKETLRLATFIPAVVFYTALVFLADQRNGTGFELELADVHGKPLPGIPALINVREGGLTTRRRHLSSNGNGKLRFRLRRNQWLDVHISPPQKGPDQLYCSLNSWNLSIRQIGITPERLEIRHSWQRPVGDVVLNEGFIDILPAAKKIRYPLRLRAYESLEPGIVREKVRNAVLALKNGEENEFSALTVESFEFIPTLIETYRQNASARGRVVEALAQIASLFPKFDAGCKNVIGTARSASQYSREHLAFQISQLRTWAAVAPEQTDNVKALEQARDKEKAYAEQLIAFVLDEMVSYPEAVKVLDELQHLGSPAIPRIVEIATAHPPAEMRTVHQQSHALWAIGAHFADLESLANSDNPFLVLLATEATPDKELEGAVASKILERLKAIRPHASDAVANRADMYIKLLEARLK